MYKEATQPQEGRAATDTFYFSSDQSNQIRSGNVEDFLYFTLIVWNTQSAKQFCSVVVLYCFYSCVYVMGGWLDTWRQNATYDAVLCFFVRWRGTSFGERDLLWVHNYANKYHASTKLEDLCAQRLFHSVSCDHYKLESVATRKESQESII